MRACSQKYKVLLSFVIYREKFKINWYCKKKLLLCISGLDLCRFANKQITEKLGPLSICHLLYELLLFC